MIPKVASNVNACENSDKWHKVPYLVQRVLSLIWINFWLPFPRILHNEMRRKKEEKKWLKTPIKRSNRQNVEWKRTTTKNITKNPTKLNKTKKKEAIFGVRRMHQNETESKRKTNERKFVSRCNSCCLLSYRRDYFSLLVDLLVGFYICVWCLVLLLLYFGGIIYTGANGLSLPGSS